MVVTAARHVALLDSAEASSHWNPLVWRPGSLAVPGATSAIRRDVPWRDTSGRQECAARACAIVVETVSRHVGQSRFQLAADLGAPGGRTVRLGFDFAARPGVDDLTRDLGAIAVQIGRRAPRRSTTTPPVEAVCVRHLHLADGATEPPAPADTELLVCSARQEDRLAIWVWAGSSISAPLWEDLLADHLAARATGTWWRPGDDEPQRILDLSTGPALLHAGDGRLVHERIAEHARRHPDRPAVSHGADTLTYGELVARSDVVATRLVRRGVGPDTVVAVYAERSMEQLACLLGILRAGGAYLAVDPGTAPPAYLATVARLGDAVAVLSDRALDLASEDGAPLPTLLDLEARGEAAAPRSPRPARAATRPAPASTAYVSFTSGTTGEPKGVSIPHHAVLRLLDEPGIVTGADDECFLAISPVAFDASTFETWVPLAAGARVVLAPTGPLDLDELCSVVRRHAVTTMWLTAGLFHRAVDTCPGLFDGVARVLAGGDVVSPAHVDRLLDRSPHVAFTNGYGPTENTTFSTWWHHDGGSIGETVPIGVPMAGSHALVLDEDLGLTPLGVFGELFVGGRGLARGYHDRPGRTAERFVPDPFHPGQRLYRTGDRARRRPDGVLEFAGRDDSQVKVRGYRIELEQVETTLASMEEVVDAAVVVEADRDGADRLVAYLRLAAGHVQPVGLQRYRVGAVRGAQPHIAGQLAQIAPALGQDVTAAHPGPPDDGRPALDAPVLHDQVECRAAPEVGQRPLGDVRPDLDPHRPGRRVHRSAQTHQAVDPQRSRVPDGERRGAGRRAGDPVSASGTQVQGRPERLRHATAAGSRRGPPAAGDTGQQAETAGQQSATGPRPDGPLVVPVPRHGGLARLGRRRPHAGPRSGSRSWSRSWSRSRCSGCTS